jgi:hypothetical protein
MRFFVVQGISNKMDYKKILILKTEKISKTLKTGKNTFFALTIGFNRNNCLFTIEHRFEIILNTF